jgi:hypothetical protein
MNRAPALEAAALAAGGVAVGGVVLVGLAERSRSATSSTSPSCSRRLLRRGPPAPRAVSAGSACAA